MVGRLALLALATVVFSGCQSEPFGCESSEQCQVDTAAGVCEANGYCSFSDPECDSGRRYSNLAGGGLAGLCVNTPGETSGPGSSSGPGTTTVTPMTGLTTELTTMGSSSSSTATATDATSTTAAESTDTGSTDSLTSGGSESTGEPDLDDGLVVYVSFDSPPQDSGRIPTEPGLLSASCNTITAACPTLVAGVVGMAGQFDGVDDLITVDDDVRLHLEDSLSMCLWARRQGPFPTSYALLAGKAFGDDSANSYEFSLSNPNEETLTYDVNFSTDTPTASAFRSESLTNDWTHLCGVWNGDAWRLYVNGRQSGFEPLVAVPSYDEHPFRIGADSESGSITHFFPGEIDEVRLYERALSADEVMSLASEG